jgi:hypothetical protein
MICHAVSASTPQLLLTGKNHDAKSLPRKRSLVIDPQMKCVCFGRNICLACLFFYSNLPSNLVETLD